MPRISTSALRKAYAIDPLLPRLLPPCRDLRAAQNELRWLREHVDGVATARRAQGDPVSKSAFLRDLVKQRASGKPLQYLLGTEFFGDVEIRCRPGVLIPRQDTATAVQRLAHLVRKAHNLPGELRVLDLCTGTGCIPLLFHHQLYAARADVDLRALGIDISAKALRLAAHNLKRLRRDKTLAEKGSVRYMQADVLANPFAAGAGSRGRMAISTALRLARLPHTWDILISNPPYISPSGYWNTTARSVRAFEPKLALVPPPTTANSSVAQGDGFYAPILQIASEVEAKIVLLEVADLDQALRVARAAQVLHIFDGIEIWREQPDEPDEPDSPSLEAAGFRVLGQGNARSVICWRGKGAAWLEKSERASSYKDVAFPDASPRAQFQIEPISALHTRDRVNSYWVQHLTELQNKIEHDIRRDEEAKAAGERNRLGALEKPDVKETAARKKERPEVSEEQDWERLSKEERKQRALQECWYGSNRRKVADILGISRASLYRYLNSPTTLPWNARIERVVQYYEDGWSAQAIADACEISRSTVYNYLRRLALPMPTIQAERTLDEEKHKHLLQHFEDGRTIQAIADDFGMHAQMVQRYLQRPLGIYQQGSRTRKSSAKVIKKSSPKETKSSAKETKKSSASGAKKPSASGIVKVKRE